jgi:hypothetical protein
MSGRWPGIGIARSAGGPWTPLDDPGLLVWFDITDAASYTLGAGNKIIEFRARNNPAILAGSANSAEQAVFTGSWTPLGGPAPRYAFSNAPAVQDKLVVAPWATLDRYSCLFSVRTNDPACYVRGDLDQIQRYPGGTYAGSASASTARRLVSLPVFCGAGATAYVDGSAAGTFTGTPWGSTPPTRFWWDGDPGNVVSGEAHDLVISNSVDTATRQKHEGYLAHKAGLAGLLPAGHPYKSAPP